MNDKRKVWLALGGAAAVAVALFAAYRRDEDPELDRAFIDGGGAATIGDTLVVRVNRAELTRFVPGDPARSWGILLDGRFIEDLAPEAGSVQETGLVATDRDGRLGREPTNAAADPTQAAGGRTGAASPPEAGVHRLRFRLRHTDGNKDAWADLLRGFPLVARDVTLRVGSRDGTESATGLAAVKLTVRAIGGVRIVWWLIGTLATLLIITTVAARSELLRARADAAPPADARSAYSLARMQLAFWTALVALGFLYLWGVTGDSNLFTPSVLTLVGISAGTMVGGSVVDQAKATAAQTKRQELLEELKKLQRQEVAASLPASVAEGWTQLQAAVDAVADAAPWPDKAPPDAVKRLAAAVRSVSPKDPVVSSVFVQTMEGVQEQAREVAGLSPVPPALKPGLEALPAAADAIATAMSGVLTPLQAQIAGLRAQIASAEASFAAPTSTGSFLVDVLSDGQGIALHRMQLLVWNAILGVLFAHHVATWISMPAFDSTLLTLVGISGGTYLGFKIPEQAG